MEYQTVYNIGLLDDLHNYFPDILYNRGRFTTVPQLLEYVHQQIDSRVNPFRRGAELYRESAATTITNAFTTPPRGPQQTQTAPPAPPRRPTRRIVPERIATPAPTVPPLVSADFITETYDITSLLNMTAIPPVIASPINTPFRSQTQNLGVLGSLLNILEGFPRTAGIPPDAFTNVPVVPSPEQIDAATTLRAARAEDEREACAVCQENYTEGQAIRSLNHCNHGFHRNCIDPWFERNVHCPVCRHDIRETDDSSTD